MKMTEPHEMKNRDGHVRQSNWRKWLGILLTLIGFFWFAKKAGWMPVHDGGSPLFWPSVMVVIGILLLTSVGHRRKKHTT
jgi:4-hydroxybenzoate polyprenyltransferase